MKTEIFKADGRTINLQHCCIIQEDLIKIRTWNRNLLYKLLTLCNSIIFSFFVLLLFNKNPWSQSVIGASVRFGTCLREKHTSTRAFTCQPTQRRGWWWQGVWCAGCTPSTWRRVDTNAPHSPKLQSVRGAVRPRSSTEVNTGGPCRLWCLLLNCHVIIL